MADRVERVNMRRLPNFIKIGVEPLPRHGDLTVVKMAAVRHLGFIMRVWTTQE